jgi:hypothetical protein
MSTATGKVYGLVAEFPTAYELYHAAEKIRDLGFRRWDCHSPFPIHHMDDAMGLKKSPIAWVVFCGGLTGSLTGLVLQGYPSLVEYLTIVHGKPTTLATIPAFFPIIFELTILLSALTAIACLMIFNRLPRWHHPLFDWDQFSRVTDDAFFLAIEATDPQFSESKTRELLESIGGSNVSLVKEVN